MKKYDVILIPDEDDGDYEAVEIDSYTTAKGKWSMVPDKIVMTEDELLDLMQESIEYSYPTLLREKAQKLLTAKLQSL